MTFWQKKIFKSKKIEFSRLKMFEKLKIVCNFGIFALFFVLASGQKCDDNELNACTSKLE